MSVFGRLSWIFLFPIIAQADEPLRVGLIEGGRAPYFFAKDDHQTGLYKDILLAISRISHIDFMFDYYPQARLRKMMVSGRLDVEVGTDPLWRQEPREAKISIYSKPFMTSQESWVVSRDNKSLIEKFISNDVTAKPCVVLGFNIEDNMKNTNSDLTGDNDRQLLEMVAKKRCDIALIPNVILIYFNVFHDARFSLFPDPKKHQLSIRLQAKYHRQLVQINEALAQMKHNGELEQLLNKYGIQRYD